MTQIKNSKLFFSGFLLFHIKRAEEYEMHFMTKLVQCNVGLCEETKSKNGVGKVIVHFIRQLWAKMSNNLLGSSGWRTCWTEQN